LQRHKQLISENELKTNELQRKLEKKKCLEEKGEFRHKDGILLF